MDRIHDMVKLKKSNLKVQTSKFKLFKINNLKHTAKRLF